MIECMAVLRGDASVDEERGTHIEEVEVVGRSHDIRRERAVLFEVVKVNARRKLVVPTLQVPCNRFERENGNLFEREVDAEDFNLEDRDFSRLGLDG